MDGMSEGPWWSTADQQARVIAHSMEVREKDLRPMKELRSRIVGPHFGGGMGDRSMEKPTNTAYGFYARYRGDVLGGDLRCQIAVDPGSPEEPFSLAYEASANEVYQRSGGPELMELVFGDMCCGYGAVLIMPPESSTVTLSDEDRQGLNWPLGVNPWPKGERQEPAVEPTPLVDQDPRHPRLRYLEPSTWFWDRSAFTMAEAEFYGYETTHNIHELLEQAKDESNGWDADELRHIATKIRDSKKNRLRDGITEADTVDGERDRVTLITLICYTAEIEGEERPEGHNAVAYVLWSPTDAPQSARWVKKPAWFFCPPFPNVALFYQHMAGEDALPFSSLVANKTKIEARDAAHGLAYRRIKDLKRGYVMDARRKGDADRIEAMKDGEIIPIPNLSENGGMQEVIKGGLDAPLVAAIQYLDQLAMEDLGLSAAARGGTSGDTATENQIAEAKGNSLVQQFAQAFNRGAAHMFRAIAWYAGHDSTFAVRTDVDTRAADKARKARDLFGANEDEANAAGRAAAEMTSGIWQGGDFSETAGLDFNAFRFKIDAVLQRTRSLEERRMESAQFRADLVQVLQAWATLPFFDFSREIRRLEEDYGRRGLLQRVNKDALQQFTQVQMAGNGAQATQLHNSPSNEQRGGGGPRVTTMDGPVMGRSETVRRAASNNGTE